MMAMTRKGKWRAGFSLRYSHLDGNFPPGPDNVIARNGLAIYSFYLGGGGGGGD